MLGNRARALKLSLPVVVLMAAAGTASLLAQGSRFTYQGRLDKSGSPASGTFDLRFNLFDSQTSETTIGPANTVQTVINDAGVFTVQLDFTTGAFTGQERWLEIAIRTNGGSTFTVLSPRQRITSAPYSITAGSVSGAVQAYQLAGALPAINGASVTSLNPTNLSPGVANINIGGNATTAGTVIGPVTNLIQYNASTNIFPGLGSLILYSNIASGIPSLDVVVNTGTNALNVLFGSASARKGNFYINPVHNGPDANSDPNTEWQVSMPGHLALGVGYGNGNKGHFQWGIGYANTNNGGAWGYQQNQRNLDGPIKLGYSAAFTFRSSWSSNSVLFDAFPGFLGEALNTNRDYSLTVFNNLFTDDGISAGSDLWRNDTKQIHSRFRTIGTANTLEVFGSILATNSLTVGDRIFATRTIAATNGIASYSTVAPVAITSTGWTNIWSTNNATIYMTGTASRIYNRAGAIIVNLPADTRTVILQPGWGVTGTGLTGTAVPF